jgi:hypothetical protein
MTFFYGAHSNHYFLQVLVQGLTSVSLLESKSGFEIATQLVDTGKRPSSQLL